MKSKILYIIFALIAATSTFAQKNPVKKADSKYKEYAYIDAIKAYERVAEKGYKSVDMFQKLGNAYYFNSELEKAAKWYGELFAMTQDLDPEFYYRYSQSLRSIGQYEKADEMMAKFNEKSGNDTRSQLFQSNKNYLDEIKANSGRYDMKIAEVNSKYSDYGAFVHDNKLYFSSARDTGNHTKRKDKWTNQYFTNLYTAEVGSENALSKVALLKKFKLKFNESSPVMTKDGKTMYFTANEEEGQKIDSHEKERFLKIYKSSFKDGQWQEPVELPFNGINYNVAHPALSPNDSTLYFSSNMPGGKGQSDIYKATIDKKGKFGKPVNLGPEINTEGKETFPFVSGDNELYFASDGRPNLGGLDIFVATFKKDGSLKKVQNIGEPANSTSDDFAYYIDSKTRYGFLSSNRKDGKGSDDVYKFLETKKIEEDLYLLEGIISDKETGEILSKAKVSLYDGQYNLIKQVETATDGKYSFDVIAEEKYHIRAEREEYYTKEERVAIVQDSLKTTLDIKLEKSTCKVAIGDNLGKCFGIKTIYFDFNKADIKPVSIVDLEKILFVMEKNPTMKIDIRAHTDSRGSDKYNQKLSDKRAKSTVGWLVKHGIKPDRLSAKGYGESQLINHCKDGVQCSEDEHTQNRRSEFIITAL